MKSDVLYNCINNESLLRASLDASRNKLLMKPDCPRRSLSVSNESVEPPFSRTLDLKWKYISLRENFQQLWLFWMDYRRRNHRNAFCKNHIGRSTEATHYIHDH